MSFLLCHQCYSWVVPRDVWCPECRGPLDAGIPDPPASRLAAELGDVREQVADVRVRRRRQVLAGRAIRTTSGLLFSPHRELGPHGELLVERPPPFPALSWLQAFTDPFWPWRIAEPAEKRTTEVGSLPPVRGHAAGENASPPDHADVAVCNPCVEEHHGAAARQLVPLLMNDPGACFVPLSLIRSVRWQRTCWLVDRWRGARLQIMSVTDADRLETLMEHLVDAQQSPCPTSRMLQQQA